MTMTIKWVALLVLELGAFGGGALCGFRMAESRATTAGALRYEMHMRENGEIVRLDKVTGTLHVVSGSFIGDLPESATAEKH